MSSAIVSTDGQVAGKRRRIFGRLSGLLLLLACAAFVGLIAWSVRQQNLDADLLTALEQQDIPAALTALKHGADPNARKSPHPQTGAFSLTEKIRQVVKRWRHAQEGPDAGDTALELAIPDETDTLLEALLRHGADPNLPSRGTLLTPLCLYARSGREHAITRLLHYGANPKQRNGDGSTALHCAAGSRAEKVCRLLLDAGADINAQDHDGETPLHKACFAQGYDTVSALLQRGADPNIPNSGDQMPLDYSSLVNDQRTIRLLRRHGADMGPPYSP